MAAGHGDSIRVLHVDDDPRFAELVASHLEGTAERFAVTTETDPEAALASIRADPPDCVVSDFDMPPMTGLELLRAVRETDATLPFVLFTGKGSEEIASDAISAGVTDYIQKGGPEKYELLANRIENAVTGRRMEAAFEAEHEKLATLIRNSPDAIAELRLGDGEAIVEAINPAFEEVFGFDGETVVGEPIDELVVPASRRDEAHELNRRAETGPAFQTEVRRLAADGPREFLLTSIPVSSAVGYAVYKDVTEARERERRLETLISNLPGMVYRCRNAPEWPMEFVGGDCEQLTGYTADQLESEAVLWGEAVLHPADRTPMWEAVQAALDREEPFEVSYRIQTRGGETRWCWEQGRGVSSAADELVALEGFILDITDYREMVTALRESRAILQAGSPDDTDSDEAQEGTDEAFDGIDDARELIEGALEEVWLEPDWLDPGDYEE